MKYRVYAKNTQPNAAKGYHDIDIHDFREFAGDFIAFNDGLHDVLVLHKDDILSIEKVEDASNEDSPEG